jgi:hypothetical protein
MNSKSLTFIQVCAILCLVFTIGSVVLQTVRLSRLESQLTNLERRMADRAR